MDKILRTLKISMDFTIYVIIFMNWPRFSLTTCCNTAQWAQVVLEWICRQVQWQLHVLLSTGPGTDHERQLACQSAHKHHHLALHAMWKMLWQQTAAADMGNGHAIWSPHCIKYHCTNYHTLPIWHTYCRQLSQYFGNEPSHRQFLKCTEINVINYHTNKRNGRIAQQTDNLSWRSPTLLTLLTHLLLRCEIFW